MGSRALGCGRWSLSLAARIGRGRLVAEGSGAPAGARRGDRGGREVVMTRPMTSAERQRLCRLRQKRGQAVLKVPVEVVKFVDACIERELLTETEALDTRKVAAA